MEKNTNQNEDREVRLLYESLLNSWNSGNALAFSELFVADGNVIGFDGSQMNGKKEIAEELSRIFASHRVATYVHVIREVRRLAPSTYMLRAVAGMIPPEKSEINSKVNAIQTLIVQQVEEQFGIVLFQNTPAVFHERPELSKELTDELQAVFDRQQKQ